MPDIRISQLPAGTVTPASILPAVNGTTTQKITVQQILDSVAAVPGPPGPDGADGPPGESITVFEQATAPTALRTGDIWLEPVAAPITSKDGLTLAEVEAVVAGQLSQLPPASVDTAAVTAAVLAELSKGNKAWTRCIEITAGFGVTINVFAQVLNGVMYLRGTYAAPYGLAPNARIGLPNGFPSPAYSASIRTYGTSPATLPAKMNAVLNFGTDGSIYFDAPDCNTIYFDGISFPVA